jgi:hypothetical protein
MIAAGLVVFTIASALRGLSADAGPLIARLRHVPTPVVRDDCLRRWLYGYLTVNVRRKATGGLTETLLLPAITTAKE